MSSEVTHKPYQYIADIWGGHEYRPPLRDIDDITTAKSLMLQYARARVAAVAAVYPERPAVLLSGGIDSAAQAAMLAHCGLDPLAVTVACDSPGDHDAERSAQVCASLGIEHLICRLEDDEVAALARRSADLLGTDELFEVGAAITILSGARTAFGRTDGALFSGIGTDQFFSGGRFMSSPPNTDAIRSELSESIWSHICDSFTEDRLVPDFFERLLGPDGAPRVIQPWATEAGWQATSRLGPDVLFSVGPTGPVDKLCLRDLAVDCGLDRSLAWAPHSPMQESNGIMAAFERLARRHIAKDRAQSAYRDPMSEPARYSLARLWLRSGCPAD